MATTPYILEDKAKSDGIKQLVAVKHTPKDHTSITTSPMPQSKRKPLTPHFTSQPDIKRIQVYMNGNEFNNGYKFLVHPKQIRNFDVFLSQLTDKIQPAFGAVRGIYTPINGTRVRSLSSLQHEGQYVAGGVEPFRVFNYSDIEVLQFRAERARKPTTVTKAKRPQKNRFQTSAPRRRNSGLKGRDPIIIFVYRNGDDVKPAERFIVRKAELNNWELFLQRIGQTLLSNTGYIKRLYDMQGQWIRGSKGIKHGEYYVAVGGYEAFRQMMYGRVKTDKQPSPVKVKPDLGSSNKQTAKAKATASKVSKTTPAAIGKVKTAPAPVSVSAVATKPKPRNATTTSTKSKVKDEDKKPAKKIVPVNPSKTKPTKYVSENPIHSSKIKRPNDSEDSAYVSDSENRGRRNSQNKNRDPTSTSNSHRRNDNARAFQIIDSSPDEGLFYAQPLVVRTPKKVKMVDYDEDSGGVYKSKSPTSDTRHAQEVQESDDVNVDLPIDQLEALEIKDEDVDDDTTDRYEKDHDVKALREESAANGIPYKMAAQAT